MKRNRRAAWAAAGLLALLLLPAALHWFEARDPDGIHSLSDTIWYTLVTLTTVGYGDVIPATPGGKLIGAILALLSTILSAFLISLFLSLLLGRLLPLLRLLLRRGGPASFSSRETPARRRWRRRWRGRSAASRCSPIRPPPTR